MAELALLRSQNVNETSKLADPESVVKEDEGLAMFAKPVHGVENSSSAPSTEAYTTIFAERHMFKNHYEALVYQNQCIPDLAYEAI